MTFWRQTAAYCRKTSDWWPTDAVIYSIWIHVGLEAKAMDWRGQNTGHLGTYTCF